MLSLIPSSSTYDRWHLLVSNYISILDNGNSQESMTDVDSLLVMSSNELLVQMDSNHHDSATDGHDLIQT